MHEVILGSCALNDIVYSIAAVDQVLCDQYNNKVMVTGNAKPESVLKKLKSVKRDTLMWHSHK